MPLNLGQKIERARSAMMAKPDAIGGKGLNGSGATLAAAACILRHGLSVEEAWPLLVEFNRTKCHPSWDEDDTTSGDSLRRILESAAKSEGKAAGAIPPFGQSLSLLRL